MAESPVQTFLLGPQTALSHGLNALIRDQRRQLARGGLVAKPSRLASPILRRAANARTTEERRAEFATSVGPRPTFLAALNFFGPPQAGLMKREMFPGVEASLARLAEVSQDARIVLCVDALPEFFLAAGSEPLETRVRRTPWEALYELSWSDLVLEVREALPLADLVVLGPSASVSGQLCHVLFGDAAQQLADQWWPLRHQISETGRAVLDRLLADNRVDEQTLTELFTSFAQRIAEGQITERLGIDKVTRDLLAQRFEEDLAAISAMPGVRVIG